MEDVAKLLNSQREGFFLSSLLSGSDHQQESILRIGEMKLTASTRWGADTLLAVLLVVM